MENRKLITTKEVVKLFECGLDAINKYKALGLIKPSKKVGNQHLWDEQYVIRMKHIIDTGKSKGKSLRHINEEIELCEAGQINTDDIKILIIEDDKGCSFLFRACLMNSSDKTLRIFNAVDGLIGVEYAIRLKPHIIILDIGLPKLHGIDVYKALKDHPSTCNSEFIITSGVVKDFQPENVKYIEKPFRIGELTDWFSGLLKTLTNESTSRTGKSGSTDDAFKQ